jgi:hypothetical protein
MLRHVLQLPLLRLTPNLGLGVVAPRRPVRIAQPIPDLHAPWNTVWDDGRDSCEPCPLHQDSMFRTESSGHRDRLQDVNHATATLPEIVIHRHGLNL